MEGEGIPNVSPAMKGNAALAMDNPQTIINVVLNGTPTQIFKNGERMYAMTPFAHRLNAPEVADLVTWIRAEWGGQTVPGDGGAGKRSGNRGKINGTTDGPATRCGRLLS